MSTAAAETVEFRDSKAASYEMDPVRPGRLRDPSSRTDWVSARRSGHPGILQFGKRVILRLTVSPPDGRPPEVSGLRRIRSVDGRTWVLEADDAPAAIQAAARLARQSGVEVAIPSVRRPSLRRHFAYAPAPNDRYFTLQTALQTAPSAGPFLPVGTDLNLRSAWALTRGEGLTLGVADDGIDPLHPDLAANLKGAHHNFFTDGSSGAPMGPGSNHGTSVAGLMAAVGGNRLGVIGLAPAAQIASWVIFDESGSLPDDAGMADMFRHDPDRVAVQNHSWGNSDFLFIERQLLENLAIEEAVTTGRRGRGVILVRSAGNTREIDFNFNSGAGDANLDGYANDPRQISVAAIRGDGRYASYSTPGACVLVAAPSGDLRSGEPGLVTTDRTGAAGFNPNADPGDPTSADYLTGSRGFSGTSASAPLVSGCVALVLAVNPDLGWRDVPQILALSARQTNPGDPDLQTNAAGFRVSHNTGYGVPDAGVAVRLAQHWIPQGPAEIFRRTLSSTKSIPDGAAPDAATYSFAITRTLLLQQVQLRVRWAHDRGQDLEVRITSPGGTVSRLLRPGTGDAPVPAEWTFHSVLHLGERSQGDWTVAFIDHEAGVAGTVSLVELVLTGRPITDTDNDGLADPWEKQRLGSLASGPRDDPDGDGWSNAAEQLAGSNPGINEIPFVASLATHSGERLRLSWPSTDSDQFEIWGTPHAGQPLTLVTNAPGRFPEAGWFPEAGDASKLFQLRRR
jgi:subtilisin family serine protease